MTNPFRPEIMLSIHCLKESLGVLESQRYFPGTAVLDNISGLKQQSRLSRTRLSHYTHRGSRWLVGRLDGYLEAGLASWWRMRIHSTPETRLGNADPAVARASVSNIFCARISADFYSV